MYILKVASEISTLRECLLAQGASEGPLACMLPKMISQVATLLKDTLATSVLTLEVKLYSLRHFMLHLDCFMPLFRNSLESLGLNFGHSDVHI